MKDKCIKLSWAYVKNEITKEEFYKALDDMENRNLNLF